MKPTEPTEPGWYWYEPGWPKKRIVVNVIQDMPGERLWVRNHGYVDECIRTSGTFGPRIPEWKPGEEPDE